MIENEAGFSCLTLPLQGTLANNRISLILPEASVHVLHFAIGNIRTWVSKSFVWKPEHAGPRHTDPRQNLRQSGHSLSAISVLVKSHCRTTYYTVIIVVLCVEVRKIQQSKIAKNRRFQW